MVNEELLNEVKSKLSEGGTSEDIIKLFEVYKQLSTENQGLKDEFEDMEMLDMVFSCLINISDQDKKFWLSFKEGIVDYGEGDIDSPSLTFTTTMEVFTEVIFGQVLISSAHEEGKVSFGGESEALMDLQAITSIINEFLQIM